MRPKATGSRSIQSAELFLLSSAKRPGRSQLPLISLRWIDPVQQRTARFEPPDVVENDRGGGGRMGRGCDVWRHDDARMAPKRVAGGQRLVAKDVEHSGGKLTRSERREQILLDQVTAACGIDQRPS